MTDQAITAFILCSEISYDYGLITRRIFYDRISKLYELNGHKISDYYYFKESSSENAEELYEQQIDNSKGNEQHILEISGLSGSTKISNELYSKDDMLYFLTSISGKYCKWKFNEYDADDKPSIPHGHGIENRKLKLDPYRALIFNTTIGFNTYTKEDDHLIKYLWNNNEFRRLALSSIQHHIDHLNKHPLYWSNYRGLTHSAKRLPRKRK